MKVASLVEVRTESTASIHNAFDDINLKLKSFTKESFYELCIRFLIHWSVVFIMIFVLSMIN